ncbi:MAG TPA: hypothetical protein PKA37_17875, partial [Planctomycetota bacterium]|nr:hypothetical protein [Planctomycetota bacterium]
NVNAMVLTAGGSITSSGVLNVYGISLDPLNTNLSLTPAGFPVPGLLFTVDNRGGTVPGLQNQTATAIYSNQGAGTFATLNGVTMNNPLAVGANNLSFSNGFYAGPLDALSVVVHTPSLDPMADRPVHLDAFPFDRTISDPLYNGILTCYVSGLPPGSLAGVFARLDVATPGGFISRFNVEGALSGYPDLYVDPFGFANQNCVIAPSILFPTTCQIPGAQAIFNGGTNPVLVWTDPNNGAVNGDTCFQIDLSSYLLPGVIPPVPTPMITLQVLDFTNLRLSSPLSFQLN